MASRQRGKIKSLKEDKGYGFIQRDGGNGKDLFFHMSALNDVRFEDLREGETVEFSEEQSEKGMRAVNVRPV